MELEYETVVDVLESELVVDAIVADGDRDRTSILNDDLADNETSAETMHPLNISKSKIQKKGTETKMVIYIAMKYYKKTTTTAMAVRLRKNSSNSYRISLKFLSLSGCPKNIH